MAAGGLRVPQRRRRSCALAERGHLGLMSPKQALAVPGAQGGTFTWAPQARELSGRPQAAGQEIWTPPLHLMPGSLFWRMQWGVGAG